MFSISTAQFMMDFAASLFLFQIEEVIVIPPIEVPSPAEREVHIPGRSSVSISSRGTKNISFRSPVDISLRPLVELTDRGEITIPIRAGVIIISHPFKPGRNK